MWHLILLPPFIHRLRKKQQAPVLHANTQPPTAFHMSEMKPYIFHDLFSLHILASITFLPNWIVHGSAEQKENNEKKMENGCKKKLLPCMLFSSQSHVNRKEEEGRCDVLKIGLPDDKSWIQLNEKLAREEEAPFASMCNLRPKCQFHLRPTFTWGLWQGFYLYPIFDPRLGTL